MTVFVECPKCHTVTYPEGVVDRAELIAATAAAEAAGKVQAELDREREHRASERALLEQRAKDLTSELEGRSESLRRERAAADSYGAALRVAEDKVRGLAQRIDAARLVLDRIQWAAGGACPSCRGPLGAEDVQQDGHARDCELAKLLRVSP